jgi:hypothetical protein
MSAQLLKAAGMREHAIRGNRGRSCWCCCDYGSTHNGAKNRQKARHAQRARERQTWKAEMAR